MARCCFLFGFAALMGFGSVNAGETGSADLNGDGVVDMSDLILFSKQFGAVRGDENFVEGINSSELTKRLLVVETLLNVASKNISYLFSVRDSMQEEIQRVVDSKILILNLPCKIGEVGETWADIWVDWKDLPDFFFDDARESPPDSISPMGWTEIPYHLFILSCDTASKHRTPVSINTTTVIAHGGKIKLRMYFPPHPDYELVDLLNLEHEGFISLIAIKRVISDGPYGLVPKGPTN